jgi:hypothetical protein
VSVVCLFLWNVGLLHLKVSATECANIKFHVLLYKSPSETLQMLEELNCVVWRQWRKRRFKISINVLMMVMCQWQSVLWVTIGFEQWHKHQECALCCVKWGVKGSKNASSWTKLNMNDQCQAQYMAVQHPSYSTDFVTTCFCATKMCSQRTMICEHQGSHRKIDESTDRGIKKRFTGMFPEALWALAKVCHCPKELLWMKCCVNRCMVTYFCVINKFW